MAEITAIYAILSKNPKNGALTVKAEIFNLTETTVDSLMKVDTLVIEQLHAPGYPDLLVIVKHMMPIFVWIEPGNVDNATWHESKKAVEANVEQVNATVFDIETAADLDRLLGMIRAVRHATVKLELPATAEAEGFDPVDEMANQVEAARLAKRAKMLG